MRIRKIIKLNSGFTLIELIVSIFIIVMITTLSLVNYRSTNNRSNLINASQKLASDIRLVQSYSLGAKVDSGVVPAGGWGIRFNTDLPNKYIIFADNNDSKDYNSDEEINTVDLPNGIIVSNIIGVASSPLDIVFYPPDPNTYFNGKDEKSIPTAVNSMQIELTDGQTVKTIEVNFLGLVDVVD